MADLPTITDVRFTPAPPCQGNLVGIATCTIDILNIDLLVVRTEIGLRVVFPKRRDRHGERHSLVRPVSEAARVAIERAVLAEVRS